MPCARWKRWAAPLERVRTVAMSACRELSERSAPATPTMAPPGVATGTSTESMNPRPNASTYGSVITIVARAVPFQRGSERGAERYPLETPTEPTPATEVYQGREEGS